MGRAKTLNYVILHYFTAPTERIGVPFVLLAAGRNDRSLVVMEGLQWRAKVEPRHAIYVEKLLGSFLTRKGDIAGLFEHLSSMSAGSVRVVETGSSAREDLARLIT